MIFGFLDNTLDVSLSCPESYKIFLWFYLLFMKYFPTTLIVGLNITIAWKMKSVAKARKRSAKNIVIGDLSSVTTFSKKAEFSIG